MLSILDEAYYLVQTKFLDQAYFFVLVSYIYWSTRSFIFYVYRILSAIFVEKSYVLGFVGL